MGGHATKQIDAKTLWGGKTSPFSTSYGKLMMWIFLLSDAFKKFWEVGFCFPADLLEQFDSGAGLSRGIGNRTVQMRPYFRCRQNIRQGPVGGFCRDAQMPGNRCELVIPEVRNHPPR